MDIALAIHRLNPAGEYRLNDTKDAILEWRGPGKEPTHAELQAAWAAIAQEEQATASADTTLRNSVLATAQGAVGKALASLTAGERNALVAILLWQAGAIKADGTIRPLAEWARDRP
jgi:hypothetical protein